MVIAIVTFFAVFLLIGSGGLFLVRDKSKPQPVNTMISQVMVGREPGLRGSIQQATASISGAVGRLEGVIPKSEKEVSILRQRLIRAGYREDSAMKVFYGGKFVLMLLALTLVLVTKVASYNYFIIIFGALAFGFVAPDFWLSKKISKRQRKIRLGLPDVLDMLVVCVEAGLSLDQSVVRTATELEKSSPALSDELKIVALEQRAGCPRDEAWNHLAERTDVDQIRHLVTMLVQSEKFGTSIAKVLRVHSENHRAKRIQQVEEQAAKTTIKILFPLVFFIFPSLFLVVLGPAMILMFESFGTGFSAH